MHDDFKRLFENMISGEMPDAQIAQSLITLEEKGIDANDLYIGASVLREKMQPVVAPRNTIDIVGTGGDGLSTYNISTTCCFVVAGTGVPVAKHGNRAVSSKSGSSDVLRALGVNLNLNIAQTEHCLDYAKICFLFAPNHHAAMKNVAKARAMVGKRTIFNRLGPLVNPANVSRLLVGVYDNTLRKIYADALVKLGIRRALVVHGGDGMDEITTTTTTSISAINDGNISEFTISPEDFGLEIARPQDIEGGDSLENAQALRDVLNGQHGAYRDIVILNSGAALYIAGAASSIGEGLKLAQDTIDSGRAAQALSQLIEASNG